MSNVGTVSCFCHDQGHSCISTALQVAFNFLTSAAKFDITKKIMASYCVRQVRSGIPIFLNKNLVSARDSEFASSGSWYVACSCGYMDQNCPYQIVQCVILLTSQTFVSLASHIVCRFLALIVFECHLFTQLREENVFCFFGSQHY